jgi:hypothetical protein
MHTFIICHSLDFVAVVGNREQGTGNREQGTEPRKISFLQEVY